MKPGIKTTEFWMSLIPAVVGLLLALGVVTPEQGDIITGQSGEIVAAVDKIIGAVMTIVVALGYAKSRGVAKNGSSNKFPFNT